MSVGSMRWKNYSAVPMHRIFGRQYKSGNINYINVYCTIKIPKVAEGNPKSCMRIFPIIADAFGISLRPQ